MYRSYLYYYILLLLFYNTAAVALQTNAETASGGQQVRNLKIICNFESMFYLFARPYIDLPSHSILGFISSEISGLIGLFCTNLYQEESWQSREKECKSSRRKLCLHYCQGLGVRLIHTSDCF